MDRFRTEKCRAHGHAEFTVQMARNVPSLELHKILIDYFEGAVANGTKFRPGETVQLGWATLRLCQRTDGTIGVEERELVPDEAWIEAVDRAVLDLWYQREIVASVGLLDEVSFPRQYEGAMISDCAMDGGGIVMTRLPADDLPSGFSGWTLSCTQDHDHGERSIVPLLAIAANQPSLVQLLALPHGTSVLVVYQEKTDAPSGMLRIEPHVFRDGEELKPEEGSYLDALQRP
jgi:hypothetical protein